MAAKPLDAVDLRLYGEHINLNSRTEDDKRISHGYGRPKSALNTSNLTIPDSSKRRPFSAGNLPKSISIQPFFKRVHTERKDLMPKSLDSTNRSLSIPGAVESQTLFNKLLRDPIANSKQQRQKNIKSVPELVCEYSFHRDNLSDISSVDTATSFGTKIKNRAEIDKKLLDGGPIDGVHASPLRLIKSKSRRFSDLGSTFKLHEENNILKEINDLEPKDTTKLSIFVPSNNNTHEENTSSGVSSSSDVQPIVVRSPTTAYKPERFTRIKRNISINWFPEITPRTNESKPIEKDIPNINEHADIKGIVSFASESFKNKIQKFEDYEEDDDCPPESTRLYNTELSLVEEESSQESEISPKSHIVPLPQHYINYEFLSNDKNKEVPNGVDYEIETNHDRVPSFLVAPGDEHTLNESSNSKTDSPEKYAEMAMERKLKDLEEKYKVYSDHKNDCHLNSLEINHKFDDAGGLKRAWTSLENVVSKENDPICLTQNKDLIISQTNNAPDGQTLHFLQNYNNSLPITKKYMENEFSEKLDSNNVASKDSLSNSEKYSKDYPDIIINYTRNTPTEKSDYSQNDSNANEQKVWNDKIKIESLIKMNVNVHNEPYPDYLETNKAKQYTSKVIEDYKREIATIDNMHQLTLKDIRSGRSQQDSGTSADNNDEIINETATNHLQMPVKRDEEQQDTLNKDISTFINEYKNYRLAYQKSSDQATFERVVDPEVNYLFEGNQVQSQSVHVVKAKKKIKKKDRNITSKYKTKSDNESGDTLIKNRAKTSAKRGTKSAQNKRDGNSRVRFKPQKVGLSRGVTKTNYIDKESEIISWMSTKMSVCDETSSYDVNDTPTPDLINERAMEYRSDIHYSPNTSKYESDLHMESVNKTNNYSPSKNMQDDKEYAEEQNISRDKNKIKEVSFEVDMRPDSVEDNFTISDWIGNKSEENNICDLIDDENVGCSIYNVLKEIDQTGNSMANNCAGDRVDVNPNDFLSEQNRSVEYRDILTYLEKVENAASDEISSFSHTQPPFSLKVEELMELSKGELAHRAVAGALAASKAAAVASKFRASLISAANRAAARIKEERIAARKSANAASLHSTQTIARHQKFIEQLINEKKVLAERIEKLVAAVETAEARAVRANRASAERLQLELKNQRQRLSQAHQRDKQTWLNKHTQKIKDMTIRGLEGEIREMEQKQTDRILAVQKEWEIKMSEEKERHSRELRLLKESSARYLEDELDKERLLAAERLEHKRMEWESALTAASERAGAEGREVAREARKELEQWKKEKEMEFEEKRRQLEEQAEERNASIMAESTQLREKLSQEFDKYKEEYKKKQMALMKDKEMEIRAITRRERDREIERAIESMEAEAEQGRKEMQESVRRIKAKYEDDMKALEDAEQAALQRCKEARELLRESQELCAQHQITITQLEGKLRQADESRVQMIAEMELSMRTAEMKSREELEEVRSQILNLQTQHKDEMHQLYAKVKVAVSKKDDALSAARRDAATLRDRCLRLEARLAA